MTRARLVPLLAATALTPAGCGPADGVRAAYRAELPVWERWAADVPSRRPAT